LFYIKIFKAKNNITIKLASNSDMDMIENLDLSIKGDGKIKLNVPAKKASLIINGSGIIEAPISFENLGATIHGSGIINFIDAVNSALSIRG